MNGFSNENFDGVAYGKTIINVMIRIWMIIVGMKLAKTWTLLPS